MFYRVSNGGSSADLLYNTVTSLGVAVTLPIPTSSSYDYLLVEVTASSTSQGTLTQYVMVDKSKTNGWFFAISGGGRSYIFNRNGNDLYASPTAGAEYWSTQINKVYGVNGLF